MSGSAKGTPREGLADHAGMDRWTGAGSRLSNALPLSRSKGAEKCSCTIIHFLFVLRKRQWRAIATRYEKIAQSFLGVLCLAATTD
jgi:hypothetical protein